jgi:predicted nucleotide-binding protein
LQIIQPWLSGEDIPLGARWADEIARILEEADAGIICLTRDNVYSQWLNFEAGALSKRVTRPLCVYALDFSPSEMSGPLAQFQSARADKESTLRLIRTLNVLSGDPQVPLDRLERRFNLHWPLLEERLRSILVAEDLAMGNVPATAENKLDEILNLLRHLCEASRPVRPSKNIVRDKTGARSRVFIGSSTGGFQVAEAIKAGLEQDAECTLWNPEIFKPSATTIDSIVNVAVEFDFAVVVLTGDDSIAKSVKPSLGPRDNIVFELGLFTGALGLGRARTFMVIGREDQQSLPTDVGGVTVATYSRRPDGNAVAALEPVCTQIKRAMGIVVPGF